MKEAFANGFLPLANFVSVDAQLIVYLTNQCRIVGTGVILATAFIHMLPESLEQFSSPCLTGGWTNYGAFAGVFCMIASFALQLLELAAASYMDSLREKRSPSGSFSQDEMEKGDHGHVHGAAFLESEEASFRNVGVMMLELGIVMHSIIIGITLANTGNDEFVTLLIALVFHQVSSLLSYQRNNDSL